MGRAQESRTASVGTVRGVTQYEGLDQPVLNGEHRTTTAEQGRFCLARCSCGWHGPARRARSLARSDAAAHLTGT